LNEKEIPSWRALPIEQQKNEEIIESKENADKVLAYSKLSQTQVRDRPRHWKRRDISEGSVGERKKKIKNGESTKSFILWTGPKGKTVR